MAEQISPGTEEQLKLRLVQDQFRQARRRARIVGVVAGGLAAWFFAYIIFFAGSGHEAPAGRVRGELKLTIESRGTRTLGLEGWRCTSGWSERFRGVRLEAADGSWQVRLIADEINGHTLELSDGTHRLAFGHQQCDRLHIELEGKQGRRERARAYDGGLQLDCRSDRGALQGRIRFTDCYD